MSWIAVILILAGAAWRFLPVLAPALGNFCPLMALAFCGGAYFRDRRLWLVPFGSLLLSDAWLDHYYAVQFHEGWSLAGATVRMLCFAAALGLGWLVSRRRSWATLLGGSLAASLLFYLVTNTQSWAGDPGYAHTWAGWIQALTVGHPEYPPTLMFFRNSVASDLAFTGLFAGVLELAARLRHGAGAVSSGPS